MVPEIEAWFIRKDWNWCKSACQALCSWAHCKHSRRWFAVRGGSCIKTSLCHSPWCSRCLWICEAEFITLVAVYQPAAKLLGEICTVIHYHVEQVSIIACWRHLPSPTSSFSNCSVLVGPPPSNSYIVDLFRCTRAVIAR